MPDLADLLQAYRDRTGHSTGDIARLTAGVVSTQTLSRIAARTDRSWRSPDTLRALAALFGVSETVISLSAARSVGLDVRTAPRGDFATHLPDGVDELSEEERRALQTLIRGLIRSGTGQTVGRPRLTAVASDAAGEGGSDADLAEGQEVARRIRSGEEPQK